MQKGTVATMSVAFVIFISVLFSPNVLIIGTMFFTNPKLAIDEVMCTLANPPLPVPAPTPEQSVDALAPKPTATIPPTPTPFTGELLGEIELIKSDVVPENAGAVIEKNYIHSGNELLLPAGNGSITNGTKHSNAVLSKLMQEEKTFKVESNSAEPQVLIMHTHATETFRLYEGLYFDIGDTARTTDKALNICAVGAIITETLNESGINTLHDTTLNDYPSYNASYSNSRKVVQSYLAEYPSIKVVIDVHRDAIGTNSTWYSPVAEINGKKCAQTMLIIGCNNGKSINIPNWAENLAFATEWETQMEADSPGLTRPALCRYSFYNQDLTTGSLLLEVGGHGNTLNEALYAGKLAAESLAKVLLS